MSDVTFRQFAGLRNTVDPERLEPPDLTAAVNVDFDNSGRAARRAGSTTRVPGAAHSLWADGDDCLFVAGTRLQRLRPDFSSVTLADGLDPDRRASYAKVNDRIYWTNGAQTGVVDGGAARAWGMPIPAMPAVTIGAGALGAGRYQAAITHLRADGLESGAGLPVTLDLPAAGAIALAWTPPADPAIAQVALYLSEPNGMVLYRAALADARQGSLAFAGGPLALPLETQWLDAPPPGQCLAYSRGRLYIGAGAFLYATAALGFEHCDLRDYLALDGSTVRFVAGCDGGLYVGTANAVHFVAGSRFDEFARKTVVAAPALAGSAVVADGFAALGNAALAGIDVVLFASADGIYAGLPDGTVTNLSAERFRYAAGATGAAHFRFDATLNQYLLFMA